MVSLKVQDGLRYEFLDCFSPELYGTLGIWARYGVWGFGVSAGLRV